jgi:hypothetical protein
VIQDKLSIFIASVLKKSLKHYYKQRTLNGGKEEEEETKIIRDLLLFRNGLECYEHKEKQPRWWWWMMQL